MHDQLRVGVGDRMGDLREQPDPGVRVELLAAAVLVDRLSFDVLDRQERPPFRGEAGIVQTGDVGMGQRGKDVPLTHHPLGEAGTLPRVVRQFQRDWPVDEPVGPFGQPHDAHSAGAQLADQPVEADHIARSIAVHGLARQVH